MGVGKQDKNNSIEINEKKKRRRKVTQVISIIVPNLNISFIFIFAVSNLKCCHFQKGNKYDEEP